MKLKTNTAIILIAAAIMTPTFVTGKTKHRKLSIIQSSVPETEMLASGGMEFVYEYQHTIDTTGTGTAADNYERDDMLLQIAPSGLSKFSSFRNLAIDSIIAGSSVDQLAEAARRGKLSNGEFMTIFKNLRDEQTTHVELVCRDWLRYDEPTSTLNWTLSDSTITVLGYRCRMALCKFRGREWTAFYAEEIPVSEGPWKLHGLPGLIMKAYDSQKHYSFECKGIKSNSSRPITIYKVPFNNTNRRAFYSTKYRYDSNPFSYFEATGGSKITVTDQNGNPSLDAYNSLQLPYEYIERDWK